MNFLKTIVILLKLIVLSILLVVYYLFFFKDVVENYTNRLTNVATKQEPLTNGMEAPAITICFSPTRKPKKMEAWNITEQFFSLTTSDSFSEDVSMKDVIDDTSFKLDKDFYIELGMFLNTSYKNKTNIRLSLGSITFMGQTIKLTEFYTIFKGMCYLLTSDFKVSVNPLLLSVVLMSGTKHDNDKPENVRLILTSKYDALSILANKWKNLKYLSIPLEFGSRTTTVDVKESKTSLITQCDQMVNSFHQCLWLELKREADDHLEHECGTFCVPMNIRGYFDILSNETNCSTCKNLKDEACAYHFYASSYVKIISKCKIQCNYNEYSANVENIDFQFGNNYSDMSADVLILSESATRTFNKEYLIYDGPGLIGNIGGSLGLFLGVSFYGAFSDTLEFVMKKFIYK